MTKRIDGRSIKIPVKVVHGRLTYFYGGGLPTLKEGAIGDLVVTVSAVVRGDVKKTLLAEAGLPVLDASPLLVRIRTEGVPGRLAKHWLREELGGAKGTPCVRVDLLGPLSVRWRGTKAATLEPASCEIPALRRLRAESINHAYRLVSEAFEPQRRSHAANVFQEVFFQDEHGWHPLEHLRGRAEAQLESRLQLGDVR